MYAIANISTYYDYTLKKYADPTLKQITVPCEMFKWMVSAPSAPEPAYLQAFFPLNSSNEEEYLVRTTSSQCESIVC